MKHKEQIPLGYQPADLNKRARAFGQRVFLANFFYVIPAAVALGYAWRHSDRIGEFPLATVAVVVFGMCILTGIVVNTVMLKRFRCPNCGARIRRPVGNPKGGEMIRFQCPQCDIVWDTDLRRHSEN